MNLIYSFLIPPVVCFFYKHTKHHVLFECHIHHHNKTIFLNVGPETLVPKVVKVSVVLLQFGWSGGLWAMCRLMSCRPGWLITICLKTFTFFQARLVVSHHWAAFHHALWWLAPPEGTEIKQQIRDRHRKGNTVHTAQTQHTIILASEQTHVEGAGTMMCWTVGAPVRLHCIVDDPCAVKVQVKPRSRLSNGLFYGLCVVT